jgi:formylglycine-generating enzyme required for sulfatase activity
MRDSLQEYANLADQQFSASLATIAPWVEEWDDGYAAHAPVGRFGANDFGLHDLHGNLWEWCRDSWAFYGLPPRPGDGMRLDDPVTPSRILRGGCFDEGALNSRSASRNRSPPEGGYEDAGLRVAARVKR